MEETKKVETLKKDAIIIIKFGADFYQRLVVILRSILEGKSPEDLENAAKKIETKTVDEEWVLNYETMLYLVKAAEDYAQVNNLTEWQDASEAPPSVQNTPEVSP
jgi:hypothetical protein